VYDAAMNAPRGSFIVIARVICLAEWVGHQTKTYLFCFNPSTSLLPSWTHFIGLLQDWWWGRCIGVDVWGTWSSRGFCTEGCEVIGREIISGWQCTW
jgi:hypothetical protein